jgi:hypothetical protein
MGFRDLVGCRLNVLEPLFGPAGAFDEGVK